MVLDAWAGTADELRAVIPKPLAMSDGESVAAGLLQLAWACADVAHSKISTVARLLELLPTSS